MKIGILTLPQETNYGGILQTFAMQHTLRKMGHDAITIDRHNKREYPSLKIHIAGYLKRLAEHYLRGKNVSTKWNPFESDAEYKEKSRETQKFIERNIKLTRKIYSEQLKEIEDEYLFDAYVVGSDQVWLDGYCPNSFLDFVKRPGVIKIVYAASCGKRSFFNNPSKVKECRELSKQFIGISVREEALVAKSKEYLGVDAQWVLDPTMLLEPSDYLHVTDSQLGTEPIVFSYILDPTSEKSEFVNYVAKSLGVKVIHGNRTIEDIRLGNPFPSVDDWIHNLNRSCFVVTDSFHGTVFSILFNKPFYSICNPSRGKERFLSLVKKFNLEDRLLFSNELSGDKINLEKIDYCEVNEKLSYYRMESIKFLKNCFI